MGYPPVGGHKIFLELGTCANRFLVLENPPSTKNQPIWSQNKNVKKIDFLTWGTPGRGSKKFFWNSGLAPIDFSCPKTPMYQKSANLEKKFFFEKRTGRAPGVHP